MSHRNAMNIKAQTILVIDDEPANLQLVVEQLEMRGFRVLVSQDGERGLQRAYLT